jgi:UPF0271 protein
MSAVPGAGTRSSGEPRRGPSRGQPPHPDAPPGRGVEYAKGTIDHAIRHPLFGRSGFAVDSAQIVLPFAALCSFAYRDDGVMDLNADVGESFGLWTLGDDATLLSVVTSANVACGFHAGDPSTVRKTAERAAQLGVSIGAQVSYRDLVGFGRRFMDVRSQELRDDITYQIGALDAFARVAGSSVTYVKPHGALYHAVVEHEEQALAMVEAVSSYSLATGRELALLGQPGSALLTAGEKVGLRTVREAFADRGYDNSGQLLPRDAPGALVTDVIAVAERAVRMAVKGEVVTDDGSVVLVTTESICVHGDTPGAAEIARSVRTALEQAGVELAPFAP